MEATRKAEGKAIVFAAGGDKALAQAIADGVMSTKFIRHTEELNRENQLLQNNVDFWKTMHGIRRKQVFENSMKALHDAEVRRSWDYINPKTCLFIGFACGIMFEVLLTTLVML